MDIGVYFPQRSEYPALHLLGVKYAVRPVLQPPTGPNDAGFISDAVIEQTDDPAYKEMYSPLGDEVLDDSADGRARLAALEPGDFATFSNGGYGFNINRLPAGTHPGLENGGGDIIAPIRCIIAAFVCKWKRGSDWTVVVYSSKHLRRWLNFYRWLGVKRAFIWRWDQDQTAIRAQL